MHHRSRDYFPTAFLITVGVVLGFEIAYLAFLNKWLSRWLVFRFHLPVIVATAVALLAALVDRYEYRGFGPQEGIVRRGSNQPHVALTFDDGPNPKYTPRILDVLKAKDAPAAFFMIGRHVEKYPDIARRVRLEGHEIGNHTYSHRDLVPATKKTIINEIRRTDQAITRVIGIRTRLFRPPRGIISNAVRQLLVDLGFTIALWTVSAVDWRGVAPEAMVKRIMRHIRAGGIILFHDSGALVRSEGGSRGNTVEALPIVIDQLRDRGYDIVPLSKMIADLDNVEADKFIQILRPVEAGQES